MTPDTLSQLTDRYQLVLGSGSPRRVKLLGEMGVKFSQIISEVDETQRPNEPPLEYAVRLAEEKARWVADKIDDNQIVLACDTIVVLDNEVLGKPTDKNDARHILSTLSGKQHVVSTALALADNQAVLASGYESTKVFFNAATEEQIREYIESGEPMDKAGAYGIQGMGAFLVDRIEGNLDNVVGLPGTLLKRLAAHILGHS
jgi:septum formation protein